MSDVYVNRIPLRCRTCMHEWTLETKLPVNVAKFVDGMQQLRCPNCRASMLALSIEFGMTSVRANPKANSDE